MANLGYMWSYQESYTSLLLWAECSSINVEGAAGELLNVVLSLLSVFEDKAQTPPVLQNFLYNSY